MSERERNGDSIQVGDISNVSGQVAVGKAIRQASGSAGEMTEADWTILQKLVDDLKARVEQEAPPETKAQALERVTELESAVMAPEPDLTTMEYVKGWFGKNLPSLAGSVTGLVVHPIVGKLVEVAGSALADEFRRRFAGDLKSS